VSERLKAGDFEVRDVNPKRAREFIAAHHYSKGCSNTGVYWHGLFQRGGDDLLGVAQWLPPTRPAAESVNKHHWRRVLSLSRLAVRPDVPPNGATFLMGRSIRLIRREGRWVSLVTYADTFMGHTGAIYRATNWTYIGEMKGSPRYEDADGKQVARLSTKSRTHQQMLDLGYRCVGVFNKHKFVIHLPMKVARLPRAKGAQGQFCFAA
jgi:hypothetical protein